MEEKPATQPIPGPTIVQQDKTDAGQRRINLIWEVTQAVIALSVTVSTITAVFVVAVGIVEINNNQMIALMQLVGMTLLILGFYFQRTNHSRIGGVGKKDNEDQKYEGR